MVCFSETKLQSAMYLGGFWSYQTMFQRNGGCWNAARTNSRHQLVKSLGTYMCWTQLQLGNTYVQVFNCYLHPGEQQNLKDRAKRVLDIIRDVIRQDPNTPIVVCGDFNNHIVTMCEGLSLHNFEPAIPCGTETHIRGGHLDQVFVRNMKLGAVVMNPEYREDVSDHKCLMVTLKLRDP